MQFACAVGIGGGLINSVGGDCAGAFDMQNAANDEQAHPYSVAGAWNAARFSQILRPRSFEKAGGCRKPTGARLLITL